MPAGYRKGYLIAPMCSSCLDNHRAQVPTVTTNAFYSCYCRSFYTRASIAPYVVSAYEHFDGAERREHHSSLIYIVYILRQDSRIL